MSPDREQRSDAARNRARLLAAARRLFDERGPATPLDQVAKAAGVANATLYRHFETRADLIVAVYSHEVDELDRLSRDLMDGDDAGVALTEWLRAFVTHVGDKRALAQALPEGVERSSRFEVWHSTMSRALVRLLERAQDSGAVRPEVTASELLAASSGVALAVASAPQRDALLDLLRVGYRR